MPKSELVSRIKNNEKLQMDSKQNRDECGRFNASDSERSHSNDDFSCYDFAEYDVDPSPLSSPECGRTRSRYASRLGSEVKRLKIELPPAVVRNYLDDGKGSLEDLRDVKSLREVTDRAAEIVQACRVPPVQAFYYCIDYPNSSPEGFLDLKRRANLAFRLEGMRIMHMLTEQERQKLVNTPLADVLNEFRERDSRLMILSALKKKTDDIEASEILNHPACQGRVSVGGEETLVATKLLEFWKEQGDTEKRRERLRMAFAEYEMTLREDCPFCNAYIEGKVDADVNEVIGISVIASRLRGRRKSIPKYLPACEEELRKQIHHSNHSLKDCVRLALAAARIVDKKPKNEMSTKASVLAYCSRTVNYLPFSVMVLKREIEIET